MLSPKIVDRATRHALSGGAREPKDPTTRRGRVIGGIRDALRSVMEGVVDLGPGTTPDGVPAMRHWMPGVEVVPVASAAPVGEAAAGDHLAVNGMDEAFNRVKGDDPVL